MTDHLNDVQLGWVVQNRRRRQRVTPLFQAASRVVDRVGRSVDSAGWAVSLLDDVVDDVFKVNARVIGVQRDTLVIEVVDKRLIGALRLRWGFEIMETLNAHPRGRRVRLLRFVERSSSSFDAKAVAAKRRK